MPYCIALVFSVLYMFMQTLSIYAGDSGELVSAAYTWGVAHPPGYPLYMFLGGIITHIITFSTVAWRMGLLSSLPMGLSLFFLWNIVFLLTKSKASATVASVLYGLLYPVWLYAIVPEVFGLFSLFSLVILFLFLLFIETKNVKHLYLLAFFSGLSLTHHHLILLLLFSIGIYSWFQKKYWFGLVKKHIWVVAGLFFLGASMYLYAPIVSSGYPAFDWEHPAHISGFVRLVTRASYGTFKASVGTGQTFVDRGLNMLTLFQYAYKDFTSIGIGFFIIGLFTLWKKKKQYFFFFLMYLGWLLFYFFYAGFTLTSDFTLGTLERFFIIPYQVMAIGIGIGMWGLMDVLKRYWHVHRSQMHVPFFVVSFLVTSLLLCIPVRLFALYYPKLLLLKNDRTLEWFADDIFASVPEGSILNVSDDTSSFAVFYGYYVQKKRQDIRLVTFPFFQFSYYPRWIKRHYADVVVPATEKPVEYAQYLKEFIQANYPYRPVMTERVDISVPEHWVPRGLVVMYYPTLEEIPPRDQILEKNKLLWSTFHDPLAGALGTYKHMMLTDVLRNYADKRLTLAQSFLLYGKTADAQAEMKQTLRLTSDRLELYLPYIQTLISQKQCREAKETLALVTNMFVNERDYLFLFHQIFETCPEFRSDVAHQERAYQEIMKQYGTKIE